MGLFGRYLVQIAGKPHCRCGANAARIPDYDVPAPASARGFFTISS